MHTTEIHSGNKLVNKIKTRAQTVITAVGAVLLIWFLLTSFWIGIDYGNCIGAAAALFLIMYGLYKPCADSVIKNALKHTFGRIVFRIILAAVLAAAAFIIIITVKVIGAASATEVDGTVIVLGCKVNGTEASTTLADRLDTAVEYLREYPHSMCIVTGGKGNDEHISEAQCMEEYLVASGIEKSRIIKEEQAKNTRQNLLYSKEIIEKEGLNPRAVIVTSNYHQYRAGLIARRLGMETYAYSAPVNLFILPPLYIRELLSIVNQLVFVK